MKILMLKLENFRGIKDLEIRFNGDDTDIFGANGTGKTTVANAICWLITDQAVTGEKDFDPKTTGAHNLHHIAALTVALTSGEQITFRKDFYEVWKQKKGSATKEFSNNTTDHSINGLPVKKKAYEAAMESACVCRTEQIRMLMMLGYFTEEMSVEDRRKVLFEICGDVTDGEVILENKLSDLTAYLLIPGTNGQYYSTEQYKKIANEQRRKLNRDLDILPERIDEVTKSIPEQIEDEAVLKGAIEEQEQQKAAIMEEGRQLETQDGKKQALQAAIAGLNTEIETKRAAWIKKGNDANQEIYAAINEMNSKKLALTSQIAGFKAEEKRLKEEHERINAMREKLLTDYAEAQAEQWDEGQELCPTCGQSLPTERVQALREAFNQSKSQKKENINRRGQACSQTILQGLDYKICEAQNKLTEATAVINDTVERINNLQQSVTEQPVFEASDEYTNLQQRIDALRAKEMNLDGSMDEVKKIQAEKIHKIAAEIQNLHMRIARVQAAAESQARIAELEKEKRDKAAELEKLERGIYLCDVFTRAKVQMVTDRINGHFKTIHFQLFKDQINGGLRETCDPMLQNAAGEWVEYKSANTAAQFNAGLEIIDVLNQHYGTSMPVLMDRAESVCEVNRIEEQLIRFIVSAPDKGALRIKIKGEN